MNQEEQKKLVKHMLEEVEASLQDKNRTNDFIESLREQFDAGKPFSLKQVEALRRFYSNV